MQDKIEWIKKGSYKRDPKLSSYQPTPVSYTKSSNLSKVLKISSWHGEGAINQSGTICMLFSNPSGALYEECVRQGFDYGLDWGDYVGVFHTLEKSKLQEFIRLVDKYEGLNKIKNEIPCDHEEVKKLELKEGEFHEEINLTESKPGGEPWFFTLSELKAKKISAAQPPSPQ